MHEVVVCGASFAGLACADALGPRRDVLVIDQRGVGDNQTSACALPVSTVRHLGLEHTIEETHPDCWVWVRERRYGFPLPEPFCTITYSAFCAALLERSGAAFERARVEGREGAGVLLAGGDVVRGRFVVDAAGWRRTLDPGGALDATAIGLSFGAEEHVPFPDVRRVRGLHIYLRRDLVRRGYAWNFPSRDHARAGVGSFARTPLAPAMAVLRERDVMGAASARHGGVIPHLLREPVVDGVLFVGDAGGQCLPLTAEGIRSAITFGIAAGRLMGQALDGRIEDEEARRRYAACVLEHERHYRRLLWMQRTLPAVPPRLLAGVARTLAGTRLGPAAIRRYLRSVRPDALRLDG